MFHHHLIENTYLKVEKYILIGLLTTLTENSSKYIVQSLDGSIRCVWAVIKMFISYFVLFSMK